MKKKYGSGDINRKRRYAELSFLYATLVIDLFYNPTKYHSNILITRVFVGKPGPEVKKLFL